MKKVLVVDDSRTMRLEVRAALTAAGYEVIEAQDGIEGLARMRDNLAMVICDVNMPRMNGIEMLQEVKASSPSNRPPVLMMTTEGSSAMIKRAHEAGATAWIVKPFKTDQLVAAVNRMAK